MTLKRATAGEIVSLRPRGSDLASAKTRASVRTSSFGAIRPFMPAGAEIPMHKAPGRRMLHRREGHVRLGLAEGSAEMRARAWFHSEGDEPRSLGGVAQASRLLALPFDA